jgi:selenide,water dikinase
MLDAAGLNADLYLEAIPFLEGAETTVRAGIVSSLQAQNQKIQGVITNLGAARRDARYPLLFDPQTAGGLLAGVPSGEASLCVAALKAAGYSNAAKIGDVTRRSGAVSEVTIVGVRGE